MDIMYALFWEFSFFGDLDNQKIVKTELRESAAALENGTAETVTAEFKEIDGKRKLVFSDDEII